MKVKTASFTQQLHEFIKYLTCLGSIPLSVKWGNGTTGFPFPTGNADYIPQAPLQLDVAYPQTVGQ